MKNKLKTFFISENICNRVEEVCDFYNINPNTLYNMAMYNCCKSIISGQFPMIVNQRRNVNKGKTGKKIDVVISEELYNLWFAMYDKLKKYNEKIQQEEKSQENNETDKSLNLENRIDEIFDHILCLYKPLTMYLENGKKTKINDTWYEKNYESIREGRLFERYLEMELYNMEFSKKIIEVSPNYINNWGQNTINLNLEIPNELNRAIDYISKQSNLSDTELYSYLFLKGLLTELNIVYSDIEMFNPKYMADLDKIASYFGITPLKALSFEHWIKSILRDCVLNDK